MKEDTILETIPELDYIRQWSEAIDTQQYEVALSILNKGLKFAKKRGSLLFIQHFKALRQETRVRLKRVSDGPRKEAELGEKQEARSSCSFCGKRRAEVSTMVAGAEGFICDGCINLCYQIITKKSEPGSAKKSSRTDKKSK